MGVDILPVKAAVYNKQPHILKVKKGMQRDPKYTSDRYTFMLPHKHFDLREGEILWVDKLADAYAVCVRRHNQIDREALPCMWLFDDGWKPIAYTQEEFGSRDIPDIPPGDYSIGMRWLNSAGLELTNEAERTQTIANLPKELPAHAITTMMNWEANDHLECTHSEKRACSHGKTCSHGQACTHCTHSDE